MQEEIRQQAIKALKVHKRSWLGLGKMLTEISTEHKYKDWGFTNFQEYCKQELGVSGVTAREMMTAYEYVAENEPNILHTITDPNSDTVVPDYHTLATLKKAKDKGLDSETEDKVRDTLFNAEDGIAESTRAARDMLSPGDTETGEDIMDAIRKKTKSIQKRVKKLDNEIHSTSSFDNTVLEASEKLKEVIDRVEL